jgi:hypothetical protein
MILKCTACSHFQSVAQWKGKCRQGKFSGTKYGEDADYAMDCPEFVDNLARYRQGQSSNSEDKAG